MSDNSKIEWTDATWNPVRGCTNHPYRFVFVDGCKIGAGNLCESFGIPAVTVNTNFFATAGVESRAFVGFMKKVSFDPRTWQNYALMTGGFLGDWLSNVPLNACVGNAQNEVHSPATMDSSAIIYGAVDLTTRIRTRP
jgi:hypothetical protein